MNDKIELSPNKIASYLKKPAEEFTRADLMKFIEENGIKMLNFRYVGGDGKLKLLNFVINDKEHLKKVLSIGERVDGSSLFPHIKACSSDLYVVPRYKTAFVNPFSEIPAVDVLCSYYTRDGKPLESAPENVLRKAHRVFKEKTGMTLEALGELEYYVYSELDPIYEITPQKGYHESHPFSKWEFIRTEIMQVISEIGGRIKYGHSEVGNIINEDRAYVQHEIEFLPNPVEYAADQLVIAKWVIREVAYKYGLEVSFAPKIIVGHAGSGLHIHTRVIKDDKNMIADCNGLNDNGKKLIAGMLGLAGSLSAFGNTVPTSYLRLVPHQEAPTNICWGDSNRSVLVRVPLGWGSGVSNMILDANPAETESTEEYIGNQTVELRSPDGSANVYLLLAGITVAARHGFENKNSLDVAKKLYVKENVAKNKKLKLPQLPGSCFEAGDRLLKQRAIYEKYDVFPENMIDGLAEELKEYKDQDLSEKVYGDGNSLQQIVDEYFHCG